jgi:hypothetical protein
MPKSLTFAAGSPDAGSRTFAGLMSRCSTPRLWACYTHRLTASLG